MVVPELEQICLQGCSQLAACEEGLATPAMPDRDKCKAIQLELVLNRGTTHPNLKLCRQCALRLASASWCSPKRARNTNYFQGKGDAGQEMGHGPGGVKHEV